MSLSNPAKVMLFDRMTDRSRKVIQLAAKAADELGHKYIGTEHLLIGIIREEGGVACHALTEILGVRADRVIEVVKSLLDLNIIDTDSQQDRPESDEEEKPTDWVEEKQYRIEFPNTNYILIVYPKTIIRLWDWYIVDRTTGKRVEQASKGRESVEVAKQDGLLKLNDLLRAS